MADKKCSLLLTQEDVEGLDWLSGVLQKIGRAGESHRNYFNAAKAAWALVKLKELSNVHTRIHDGDDGGDDTMEFAELRMRMQPPGEA